MNTPKFTVFNDDGDEVLIPAKFEVCPRCDGSGVHDHPAFSNGISAEDWNNDWDDDDRENYLRGRYDVPCSECRGLRVVASPDRERLTPDQCRWLESHYEALAESRAEQHMRERGIEF